MNKRSGFAPPPSEASPVFAQPRLRILFVDDEQEVLNGLRCALRHERKRWDLHWAHGPMAALEVLGQESFDVVVSDMRMPGLDGAELLQQVRERHPEAMRIVLSGQADALACNRAIPVAQSWLDKPCSRERMVAEIERAAALRAAFASRSVAALLGERSAWPQHPPLHRRMCELLSQRDKLDDLVDLLEGSPSVAGLCRELCAIVLGDGGASATLRGAAACLGTSSLLQVVLAAELFETLLEKPELRARGEALLRHAAAASWTARSIAKSREPKASLLAIAGLLHDTSLVYATPGIVADPLQACLSPGGPAVAETSSELGHAEAGANLLALWGAPLDLVELVAFHHQPAALFGGVARLGGALHLADALDAELLTGLGAVENLDMAWLGRQDLVAYAGSWREMARRHREHAERIRA